MPVTLAQASLNAANDIDRNVIDEFRKSSWLMDNITFDDAVNPSGGGATLTYGYQRVTTQANAAFRAINSEYTPGEAAKTEYTVALKPFGGSFQIDRVLDAVAAKAETRFQLAQKINATIGRFNDASINATAGSEGMDGLDAMLAGSAQEVTVGSLNWQTVDEATAFAIMEALDTLTASVEGGADAILTNKAALAKIRAAARRAGYLTPSEDSFGRTSLTYNGVALIDLGQQPGATTEIIPVTAGTPDTTDVYAVRLGLDGFHAVSLAGRPPIQTWLPDFSTAGAVKTGEVEMVASFALKSAKAAAVIRDVQVAA